MSSDPLVTIAMPVHNGERTLALAVKSLVRQSYKNWQLFIADDGSSDATPTMAKSYKDPRIRVLTEKRQRGVASRLNQILEKGGGKYFARLDADDVALPGRVEKQVRLLEENAEIDLVGTGAVIFSDEGTAIGKFPAFVSHANICKNPWQGFYLAHPTWLGRMDWFRRFQYCEEVTGAEDQDLLLRSHKISTFACLPELLTGYRQGKLSLKKSLSGRYNFTKAIIRYARKRFKYSKCVHAVGMQVLKAVVDTFAISTGLNRRILKHRALPLEQEEIKRWNLFWQSLQTG